MLCHVFWSQVEYKIICFITYARSTFPVCENYRERIVESNVVHSNVMKCPTSDSVANLSL